MTGPARGEVWLVDLGATLGREQKGRRPALVVSHSLFNRGPAGLVVVVPMTGHLRPIPSHVRVKPPDSGLDRESSAMCEMVRSISRRRLVRRLGAVGDAALREVEEMLRTLLVL